MPLAERFGDAPPVLYLADLRAALASILRIVHGGNARYVAIMDARGRQVHWAKLANFDRQWRGLKPIF